MLDGFSQILKILVSKISRKAAVITISMILIYLLGSSSTSAHVGLCVGVISFLSIFFTLIQAFIDNKTIISRESKEEDFLAPNKKNLLDFNKESVIREESFQEAKEGILEQ